jgi:hypothetical protein
MRSRILSFWGSFARMDTNENPQEKVSRTAIMEVTSLTRWVSNRLFNLNEVITKKQKPNRFAAVPKICCEVVFDIAERNGTVLRLLLFQK